MRVVALDLSLTATGVCRPEGPEVVRVKLPSRASDWDRAARLDALLARIGAQCVQPKADLVIMEGYSYGSVNTHAHSAGELGGVVKLMLFQHRIPFVLIPPKKVRKYATGSGNADKDAALVAAVRQSQFDIRTNDEADAYWLWHMAMAHYLKYRDLPQYRSQLLEEVEWPELGGVAVG